MDYAKIYSFDKAPKEYQDLSNHGGDEDYIIVFEENLYFDEYIIERLTICNYEKCEFGGKTIYITAHA